MSETRGTTPSAGEDVRERVAKEVYLWEATRFGADESWALRRWREESNTRRRLYFNVADRIIALLRTPRGEGEAEPVAWLCEAREQGGGWTLDGVTLHGASAETWAAADPATRRAVPLYAAPRFEAQGEEADALDLIRWAESQGAALEPVAGNLTPPGTYACYVGDDDDPYMGPGILGAIRAARRGEGGGE